MNDTMPFLHGKNLSIAGFLGQPTPWKDSVLGALCFSTVAGNNEMMQADTDMPCLCVPMQALGVADSICEVWQGSGDLKQGRYGTIRYRQDDNVLFGVIELSEAEYSASADKTPLQQATESAYRQIFELINTLPFPYLYRFWNYIADINGHSFGLERYRQFNLGRQAAFLALDRDVVGNVPAACALGLAHGSLSIAFLAGQVAPRPIENPRQISAYQYPPQYGPRSPTFSRASLVQMGDKEVLLVSGTASIVGHATLHPVDVVAQTGETITNIETVLTEANRIARGPGLSLADLHYRVYVRHPSDLRKIQAEFSRRLGSSPRAMYLQADVCRHDLLVEIEASAQYPSTKAPQ